MNFPHSRHCLTVLLALSVILAHGQAPNRAFVYGDLLPDAPELAARGEFSVGVQTVDVVHRNQIDILNYGKDHNARYDRPLRLEIWYPASLADGAEELVQYDEVMGNANAPDRPLIPFSFPGRASRNAKPLKEKGPYPLVIVSHGYTGSRFLLTYLTENLASKGYVVVAIDHTESTFRDAAGFASTLLNRSLDDLFVLDEIARLARTSPGFLYGLVQADQTALIGYSMGGYGALNVVGAGYSSQAVQLFSSLAGGSQALATRMVGNPSFEASVDPRIKVVVAFAPWGMQRGVWDAAGLANIKIPLLLVAGTEDDISGYADGIKAIFEGAVHSDRYLLSYVNARHNVAPNPPPPESLKPGLHLDEYLRYADSAWDQRRINNINQHFVTAFLGLHLKQREPYQAFLRIGENANTENWKGFKPRTSVGLQLHHAVPAP